jgi:hypothetical protein
MLTKNLSLQSITRSSGLALLAVVAFGAAQPSAAVAAQLAAPSVSQSAAEVSTDFSAARRHRQVRQASPRNAYGSYVGGAGAFTTQSRSGYSYGYGVGDNSRGQTW